MGYNSVQCRGSEDSAVFGNGTAAVALVNPRRACAARVMVLLLCVCVSVCLSVCLWSFQLTLRWLFRS